MIQQLLVKQSGCLVIHMLILSTLFYSCSSSSDRMLTVYPDAKCINNPEIEFSSLEEAVLAAKSKPGPCTIELATGWYFLNKTVLLDSLNNGLVITAQKDANLVIYGGKQVEGWKEEGKFLVANVPNEDFRMLEISGRFAERSRFPETGTLDLLSEFNGRWLSTFEGGFDIKPTEEQLLTMKYKPADLGSVPDLDNAEITLYHMWDETLMRVAGTDSKKNTVTFTQAPAYAPVAWEIKKYILWNVKSGMTKPGQWYLDRKAGKVYYWPLVGESNANIVAIIPVLNELIRIENAKNIKIASIGVRINNTPLMVGGFGAKWFSGAINAFNCQSLTFDNLTLCNLNFNQV